MFVCLCSTLRSRVGHLGLAEGDGELQVFLLLLPKPLQPLAFCSLALPLRPLQLLGLVPKLNEEGERPRETVRPGVRTHTGVMTERITCSQRKGLVGISPFYTVYLTYFLTQHSKTFNTCSIKLTSNNNIPLTYTTGCLC